MTCLYAIGGEQGPIKIGFSDRPRTRIGTIKNASPVKINFMAVYDVGNLHRQIEQTVHTVLREERVNGEWFEITAEEALAAIHKTADLLQIELVPTPINASGKAASGDASDFDASEEPRAVGRPKSDRPKQIISIRLDADLLDLYRASGPGWQSRINEDLKKAVGMEKEK